jgi:hypothetical protein
MESTAILGQAHIAISHNEYAGACIISMFSTKVLWIF